MDNNEQENNFNEEKARELVYYLLENDTSIFKRLIPEIRAMDSNSFYNLFQGTPFQNGDNGYDYKVKNKKNFERLLDKIDNFWVIMDAWYQDKKYYKYLNYLWINYISIENLKNEKKLKPILKSYGIDYNSWPQYIKDNLKRMICATKKTRILNEHESDERNRTDKTELEKVMDDLVKFKKKIEEEPGMEIFEKNIEKQEEKVSGFFSELKNYAGIEKFPSVLGTTGKISGILCLYNILFGQSNQEDSSFQKSSIKNSNDDNHVKDFHKKSDHNEIDDSQNQTKIQNWIEKARTLFENKYFSLLHVCASLLLLGCSIYEFNEAKKDLKKIKDDIKEEIYDNKLKEIEHNFNLHKNEIGILPEGFKESIEKIKDVLNKIKEDYIELEKLIKTIQNNIDIAIKYKNKATLGLIGSGILGITAIGGFFLTKNPNQIWYGVSTVSNAISAMINGSTIEECNKVIKDLSTILNKANKQKSIILKEIKKLIKIISDMEKGIIPKLNVKKDFSNK